MSADYHSESLRSVEGMSLWKRSLVRTQPPLTCDKCGAVKVWYLTGLGTAGSECADCGSYSQKDDPNSRCPYLQYKGAPKGTDFLFRYGIDEITVEVQDGLLYWVLWKAEIAH